MCLFLNMLEQVLLSRPTGGGGGGGPGATERDRGFCQYSQLGIESRSMD